MTLPDRATVWLRSPSGRCEPVEVDIDPPDTLAALAKWERVTGGWLLHAQGVAGLVKEHDLDHTESPGEQLGHAHPTPW